MKVLTREECRDLLNKVGSVVKFYIQQIEEVKYNPDFYEAFENIQKNKIVKINDTDSFYSTPLRTIYRDNETICLIKNTDNETYEDIIIYYLTVGFNQKIRICLDYKQLEKNEYNNETIYFDILEDYKHQECGDVYGNGKVINEEEFGYKGRVYTTDNKSVLEYGKYNYNNVRVKFPDETYESNPNPPELKDLNKETKEFKMTTGINNPVYLAFNEIQIEKIRGRQRIR